MPTSNTFRTSVLRNSLATLALTTLLASQNASADTLTASSGGTFTFNFDRNALGTYVFGSALGNNGYYLAGYWDSAASDYSNPANTANSFIANTGSTEIPATNLVNNLTPTGPNPTGQPAGRHVVASTAGFTLDSATLAGVPITSISTAGVVGEKLGMTGVQGFYLPNYESGGKIINGDFSLQYDTTRQTDGRSGWFIANNISFTMAVYDLANLSLAHTAGDLINWQLTGDLLMAPENAGMLLGTSLTDVGNFSLGLGSYTAPVPVPAAAWLFFSGMAGLLGAARRKNITLSQGSANE